MCNAPKMADGADGKLRFSRQYFWSLEKNKPFKSWKLKVNTLKNTRLSVSCTNLIFLSKQSRKQYREYVSQKFQELPRTLGKI